MDTILQFLTGVLRYVLPVLALLILAVCVISLFRNRPLVHKMAQLVDQNNGFRDGYYPLGDLYRQE